MEAGPNATEQLDAAIELVRNATAQLAAHVEAKPALASVLEAATVHARRRSGSCAICHAVRAAPALTMDRFEAIRNSIVQQVGSNRNAIAQLNAQFRATGSAVEQIARGA
jgi:hypothetical protein